MTKEERDLEIYRYLAENEGITRYQEDAEYLIKLIDQWTTEIIGERKSVDELSEIMGDAYNDLSVRVAFKEGYNKAILHQKERAGLPEK